MPATCDVNSAAPAHLMPPSQPLHAGTTSLGTNGGTGGSGAHAAFVQVSADNKGHVQSSVQQSTVPEDSLPSLRELSTPRLGLPGPGLSRAGSRVGSAVFLGGRPPSLASFSRASFNRASFLRTGSKSQAGGVQEFQPPKCILVLISDTGGGHRASAQALGMAFKELYGDKFELIVEDIWVNHCPEPFNKWPEAYAFMCKHPWMWWASYNILQSKWVHMPYMHMMYAMAHTRIEALFEATKPDLIVSIHPFFQHVPIRILKSHIASGKCEPINFATIVTDFTTCAHYWFHPDCTRCFVPTDFCKKLAIKNGLKEPQIVQHGLPTRPDFAKPLPSKQEMMAKLGLATDLPAVLIIGGGDGFGRMAETVDEIAAHGLSKLCQVVVICGRNKQLLSNLSTKTFPGGLKVTARGFTNNIHEWMHACDCVVTKAGPGTMAEALIMGLPILLNGNIPGQEEGNIPYVIENKIGAHETEPKKIADILASWLGPQRAEFEEMGRRARALAHPDAVYRIAEDLAKLVDNPDYTWGPAAALPPSKRPAAKLAS